MPIIKKIDLPGQTQVGVWKITEDADFFLKKLKLNEQDQKYIGNIKNGKRYLHWLSSRVMLRELLNTDKFIELDADEKGKPFAITTTERDITERRFLEKEILDITEREREQIGQELHDGMGQILTGIAVLCKGLALKLKEQ